VDELNATMADFGLSAEMATALDAATWLALTDLIAHLPTPVFRRSPLLARSVLREIEQVRTPPPAPDGTAQPPGPLDRRMVFTVRERFADPRLGDGLTRLEAANSDLAGSATVAAFLAATGRITDIDAVARDLPDQPATHSPLQLFADGLAEAAAADDVAAIDLLIADAGENVAVP
jgi:hypothetical protein